MYERCYIFVMAYMSDLPELRQYNFLPETACNLKRAILIHYQSRVRAKKYLLYYPGWSGIIFSSIWQKV